MATTYTWTSSAGNGVTGDWSVASNWNPAGGPPNGVGAAVLINAAGTYTVSLAVPASGTPYVETLNSLTLNAAGADLSIKAGETLTLAGVNPLLTLNAGTLDLAGGLSGGTVVAAGATVLFDTLPTLNAVTWQGPMVLAANAGIAVSGGLAVQTIGGQPGTIDGTAGNASILVIDGETLDNMTLSFGAAGGDLLAAYAVSGGTLTLGNGVTITQTGGFNEIINEFANDSIIDSGSIAVSGGNLTVFFNDFTNNGSISVTNGGAVDLSNTTLTNTGTLSVSGGGDVLLGTIAVDTGALSIGATGTIELTAPTTANESFTGAGGTLILDQNTGNAGTISGFSASDTLLFSALTFAKSIVPTLSVGNVLNLVENGATVASLQLNPGESFLNDQFNVQPVNSGTSTAVTLTVACFVDGTAIRTEAGDRPVEALRVGDKVPTVIGGVGRVVWVGHRQVDCARHPNPETVWPVRVTKDAFGPGLPGRDLWLSPDHAVYVDEVLIPIRRLMNGVSIRQEQRPNVTYHHIELEHHDVLLAEGLPAESYLDIGDRPDFWSAGGVIRLHPRFGVLSRFGAAGIWEAFGAAPLVQDGPVLEAVRARLNRPVERRGVTRHAR